MIASQGKLILDLGSLALLLKASGTILSSGSEHSTDCAKELAFSYR